MKTSESSSRRNFLTEVLIGWFAMILLPVLYGIVKYIIPPKLLEQLSESLQVAKTSDFVSQASRLVRFNKKPVILVQAGEGQIKAFSAVCTHLGCIVEYKSDEQKFRCNCHGSVFDLQGKNIGGPAPAPLKPYRVEIKADNVIISQI